MNYNYYSIANEENQIECDSISLQSRPVARKAIIANTSIIGGQLQSSFQVLLRFFDGDSYFCPIQINVGHRVLRIDFQGAMQRSNSIPTPLPVDQRSRFDLQAVNVIRVQR